LIVAGSGDGIAVASPPPQANAMGPAVIPAVSARRADFPMLRLLMPMPSSVACPVTATGLLSLGSAYVLLNSIG
jgi:hypothetical protein